MTKVLNILSAAILSLGALATLAEAQVTKDNLDQNENGVKQNCSTWNKFNTGEKIMIDMKLIRTNPELVKENIKKKFQDEKILCSTWETGRRGRGIPNIIGHRSWFCRSESAKECIL